MKRLIVLSVLCLLLVNLVAMDTPVFKAAHQVLQAPVAGSRLVQQRWNVNWSVSIPPVSILNSSYDYMIGSYNNLPLISMPASAGGGYLMTYHASRTNTGTRRVFQARLQPDGIYLCRLKTADSTSQIKLILLR